MERQVSDIKTEDDQYPIDCYAYLSKCNPVKWTCTKPEENDLSNWTEYLYRVYDSEGCSFIDCTSSYSDLIGRVCSVYTDGMVVCTDYKTLYYDSNSDSPYVVNNLVVCSYAYLSKCNPVKWYKDNKDVPNDVEYISYPTSMSFSESCSINGTSEYVSLVSQICKSLTPGMEVSNPYKYLSYDEGSCTYVIKNCCVYEFDTSNCNLYTGRCLQGDEFSKCKYCINTDLYSDESDVCKYTYAVPEYIDDKRDLYLQYDISSKTFICATDISIYLYNPFDGYKCVGTGKLTKDSINYSLTPPDSNCIYYNPKSCSWQKTPISTPPYQAIYVAEGGLTGSTFIGYLICIVCHNGEWNGDTYKDSIACTSLALPSTSISIDKFGCYQLCGTVEVDSAMFTPTTWCVCEKK